MGIVLMIPVKRPITNPMMVPVMARSMVVPAPERNTGI